MNGKPVARGYIYYAMTGRRQEVEFTPELRQQTIDTITAVRRLIESNKIPATQVVPWAPWEIPTEAIESADVVREVAKRRPSRQQAVMPMFAEMAKDAGG